VAGKHAPHQPGCHLALRLVYGTANMGF